MCTEEVAKERISFRVPPHIKGPTLKRLQSVLEEGNKNGSSKKSGGKKNAPKNKTNKGGHTNFFQIYHFPMCQLIYLFVVYHFFAMY